jgi:Aspartyl protease
MGKHESNWLDEVVTNNHLYQRQFVVHDAHRVYFSAATFEAADEWRKSVGNAADMGELLCFYVGKNFLYRYFPSVKVKSLRGNLWIPTKNVIFFGTNGQEREIEILVDSGADTTFLSFEFGKSLGLEWHETDLIKIAHGVGSTINYVEKMLTISIDEHKFKIPICWCITPEVDDILLGREGIFSQFEVLFSEAKRMVSFTKVYNG